ncbi:hypothetical protein PLICRDRAFT_170573 [Plicaturopsis crispa FD-325 SS-3]|nr:hypothetical protein PLICRDRAFT_170573 [Plicaturopsis crispa FD-325 SS-3]
MSQPPPYGQPVNPDSRPLPPGWIQQYDSNYKAWFYVNTAENPPRSIWVHPAGPAPSPPPPQNQYAPPPGGPPPPREFNQSPYPPQGGYQQGPPQPYGGPSRSPGYDGGYGGGYGGPPSGGYGGPGYGGPPGGGYGGGYQQGPPPQSRGWFGGGQSNNPPPQVVYQQAPQKSGMGMGTMLAAGGAGLVGGALLTEAFEDHDDHEREEGYDQGYQDGQDNDFDGGGDW